MNTLPGVPRSYCRQMAELHLNSDHLTLEIVEISDLGRLLCHWVRCENVPKKRYVLKQMLLCSFLNLSLFKKCISVVKLSLWRGGWWAGG